MHKGVCTRATTHSSRALLPVIAVRTLKQMPEAGFLAMRLRLRPCMICLCTLVAPGWGMRAWLASSQLWYFPP